MRMDVVGSSRVKRLSMSEIYLCRECAAAKTLAQKHVDGGDLLAEGMGMIVDKPAYQVPMS